jgi:hypothetical protein
MKGSEVAGDETGRARVEGRDRVGRGAATERVRKRIILQERREGRETASGRVGKGVFREGGGTIRPRGR